MQMKTKVLLFLTVVATVPVLGSQELNEEEKYSEIRMALEMGCFEEAQKIFASEGFDVDRTCPESSDSANIGGFTPLMYAAGLAGLEFTQFLLKGGADVTKVDYKGWTALKHAYSCEESLERELNKGEVGLFEQTKGQLEKVREVIRNLKKAEKNK